MSQTIVLTKQNQYVSLGLNSQSDQQEERRGFFGNRCAVGGPGKADLLNGAGATWAFTLLTPTTTSPSFDTLLLAGVWGDSITQKGSMFILFRFLFCQAAAAGFCTFALY